LIPTPPASDESARRARLTEGAHQAGIELSESALDQLLAYLALLQRWNRVYNLTAVRNVDDMLGLHLLDCLAALPAVRRHAGARKLNVLDVGSGGGLPGAIWAICHPDWWVTCVDAVSKKAGFLRQLAAEIPLPNLTAVHARVEVIPGTPHRFDLVTSRAFSSLADFVTLSEPQLARDGVWLALKGKIPTEELAKLPSGIEMFHVEPLRVPGLDGERCLVWMRRQAC
jgi:16S rRNA (guanine527-N7)-methyltransferase